MARKVRRDPPYIKSQGTGRGIVWVVCVVWCVVCVCCFAEESELYLVLTTTTFHVFCLFFLKKKTLENERGETLFFDTNLSFDHSVILVVLYDSVGGRGREWCLGSPSWALGN